MSDHRDVIPEIHTQKLTGTMQISKSQINHRKLKKKKWQRKTDIFN